MIFDIIGLVIAVLVLGAGIYYLSKEKHDPESRRIYSVVTAVGAVLLVGMILKIVFVG